MSRQLAVSAAFSIFMMAVYVLLGGDATRGSFEHRAAISGGIEVSAYVLSGAGSMLRPLS